MTRSVMNKIRAAAVGIVLLSMGASSVRAELAARLPEPTLVYIEFAGSEACAEGVGTTPLGKILASPNVIKLTANLWQAGERILLSEAAKEGAEEVTAASKELAITLLRKGIAIDLIEVSVGEAGPSAALVVASEVGDGGDAFLTQLEQLLQTLPMPPAQPVEVAGHALKALPAPMPFIPPIHYGVVDGVFFVALGADTPARVIAVIDGSAPNLTTNPRLSAALKKIQPTPDAKGPMGMLHIDTGALLAQGRTLFGAMTGAEEPGLPPMVENVIETLGLNELVSVTAASYAAHNGFYSASYLATEGPRKGLLKLCEQAVLTDEDLLWIPRDATLAVATNISLLGIYDEVFQALDAFPEPKAEIEEALGELEGETGLKLRDDVLSVLGDSWALYDAPSTGGLMFFGATLVAEVTDEARADALLKKGAAALAKQIDAKDGSAKVVSTQMGGHTISFLQFVKLPLPFAPAWAFHNEHVILGASPQTVQATLQRITASNAREQSILANADFVRGRKLLPEKLSFVSYNDTRAGVASLYPMAVLGAIAGTGVAREHGIEIDASLIPSYAEVVDPMFGHVYGATVDDTGILKAGHGPLPIIVPSFGGGGMVAPLAISVLLPSLSRARMLSKQLVSATNLKGVGTACMIYAYDNQGDYPPDLQTLVDRGDVTRKQLIDPNSADVYPSYTYIPGHTLKSSPHWVVAYEDYPGMPDNGVNVLFADGHVEKVRPNGRVAELVELTKTEMAAATAPASP